MIGSLVLALAAMAMQPNGLDSLGWLSGHWRTREGPMPRGGPHWSEEVWTRAEYGLMVGAHRSQRGFGFPSYGHMRIEENDRGVTLYLSDSDGAGGAYRMARAGEREAVFESVGDGGRIAYRREGDVLTLTLMRADGSQPRSRQLIRVRDRPE